MPACRGARGAAEEKARVRHGRFPPPPPPDAAGRAKQQRSKGAHLQREVWDAAAWTGGQAGDRPAALTCLRSSVKEGAWHGFSVPSRASTRTSHEDGGIRIPASQKEDI